MNPNHREGRWVQLVPIEPKFTEAIWNLATSQEEVWPWRGRPLSPDALAESLRSDVLSQFAIVSRERQDFLGIVRAERANLFHGYAYLATYLVEAAQGKGWPMESMALFVDYLFRRFGLRKLYGESWEHANDFGTMSDYVQVEGCLKDHFTVNGVTHDVTVIALHRSVWLEQVRPKLDSSIWAN
jgi:hypothetical protein